MSNNSENQALEPLEEDELDVNEPLTKPKIIKEKNLGLRSS